MPVYPLVVLGFATGLNALWSGNWRSDGWKYGVRGLIVLGLVGLIASRLVVNLPRADQSHRAEDTGLDPGWVVLADVPPANSVIVGDHSEWLALQYLTNVWGAEPPVYPRPLCQPDSPNLAENTQGSPSVSAIFLTRRAAAVDPTCLADRHRYAAGASLIRAQDTPNTQLPKSARVVTHEVGPSVRLVGYEIQPTPDEGLANASVAPWHLSLYWQADLPIGFDYTVSVRPLRQGELIQAPDGEPLIQDHQPVWSTYPTSRWSLGEVVRDDYVLSLPVPAIPDSVQIVVYRATEGGFENLGEAQFDLGADVPE